MSEETREETTVSTENQEENQEENQAQQEGRTPSSAQPKTWYPYITKTQLEKFLARLETKIPEQIDRDYVRAIIRTPSMIYRFLRGIEAMKLIDREQHPTPRLERLVMPELRKHTIAEILRDLYADLLQEWQESGETMNDDEMVGFFRNKTGMGRDSANKMKMFFKFLISEADFSEPPPMPAPKPQPEPEPESTPETPAPEPQAVQETPPTPAPEPRPVQETPAPAAKPAQEQPSPPQQTSQASPPKATQGPSPKAQEAPQERSGRDRGRGDRSSQSQRNVPQSQPQSQPGPPPSDRQPRSLTEVQKAYLQTLQAIVNVNIDGDWDDDMIRTVFDRLERLFDRIKRG